MHIVDVVAVCLAGLALVVGAAILARQRYMLRVVGAIPMALRAGGGRWLYGIGRYAGGELRWYRSLGVATRPSRVFRRTDVHVLGHRPPRPDESRAVPSGAVIVECRDGGGEVALALGESAFTGFVSWIEASTPAS